ncbi:unnamed protein product [Choristocarpus tenellus]
MGLGEDVEQALKQHFKPEKVSRVLDAWTRLRKGDRFKQFWIGKGLQCAGSYLEGLSAKPWHHPDDYPWASTLAENADVITAEFQRWKEKAGGELWIPAAGDDDNAYGDNWRKIVLQDRQWDSTNCAMFPETTKIVKSLPLPSCEVCFARQEPMTGVSLHTDNTNFVLTAHLGVDVPDGKCWIQVGESRKEWQNGKVLVFDASFMHETGNESSTSRVVLLIRFWHPEVTTEEQSALNFIFEALDDPSLLKKGPTIKPRQVLGPEAQLDRLDDFMDELKAEGLVSGYSTPEDVINQAPKNRQGRRKASKTAKKMSRRSGRSEGFGK